MLCYNIDKYCEGGGVFVFEKLAIKFLSWNLRRQKLHNIEIVVRSDGNTIYKRNKKKEEDIKKIISKIK